MEDLVYFSEYNIYSCESPAIYCIYDNCSTEENDYLVMGQTSSTLNKFKTIDNFLTRGPPIEFVVLPCNEQDFNECKKNLKTSLENFKNMSYDQFKKKTHVKMEACGDMFKFVKGVVNTYCSPDTCIYTGDEIYELTQESISYYESTKSTNER